MYQKEKYKKILHWSLEAVIIIAIVAGIHHWRTRDAVAGDAPVTQVSTIEGARLSIGAGPEPVLVHFWGTWCGICRFEQDTIESLSQDHSVVTVALASGDDGDIAGYLKDNGLTFPVVNDDDGRISAEWGVTGVPTSFVLDPAGEIAFVTSGYTTEFGLRLRLWLAGD